MQIDYGPSALETAYRRAKAADIAKTKLDEANVVIDLKVRVRTAIGDVPESK